MNARSDDENKERRDAHEERMGQITNAYNILAAVQKGRNCL
jgi:hypothetical protein